MGCIVKGRIAANTRSVCHSELSGRCFGAGMHRTGRRSEEHTSELQSRLHLVCRLLLEEISAAAVVTGAALTPNSSPRLKPAPHVAHANADLVALLADPALQTYHAPPAPVTRSAARPSA